MATEPEDGGRDVPGRRPWVSKAALKTCISATKSLPKRIFPVQRCVRPIESTKQLDDEELGLCSLQAKRALASRMPIQQVSANISFPSKITSFTHEGKER